MDKKKDYILRGVCNTCNECNGVGCVGTLPGMGGAGDGRSFRANSEALNRYTPVSSNAISRASISTSSEIFGVKVSMPVFNAPMTGMRENLGGVLREWEYARYASLGSRDAGTIFFAGDGAEDEKFFAGLWAARDAKVPFISIIKPRSQYKIMEQIDIAQSMGALAVGVDVDSCGLITMTSKGEAVEKKSVKQLEELVKFSSIPFIVKGVLSPADALKAQDIGAGGVVVSNHGGRINDRSPSAWDVLYQIRQAVSSLTLIGDGGIRTGRDVFVALALGASAVLMGRPVLLKSAEQKAYGVSTILKQTGKDLVHYMAKAGCKGINSISHEQILKTS